MIKRKKKKCKGCGYPHFLFGHGMCIGCYRIDNGKKNPLKPSQSPRRVSSKAKSQITTDNRTYARVWQSKPHICEECGCALAMFNEEGKINRFIFSHILTKGSRPDLRDNIRNFNLLCWEHHQQWETGDRRSMKIFALNQKVVGKISPST